MRRRVAPFPITFVLTIAGAMMSFVLTTPAAFAQSHLNVPASQHVILQAQDDDGTCCAFGLCRRYVRFTTEILPDGTTQPFSIPSDKVLVITDWDWTFTTRDTYPNSPLNFFLILGGQAHKKQIQL